MFLVKGILLLILFGTSSIIGVLISKKYVARVQILNDLKSALNMFEVKINFSFETIPIIFEEISQKFNGVVSKTFSNTVKIMNTEDILVGEAWEKSLEHNCNCLKREDINCLKSLGKMLGRTDVEGQVNQIRLVIEFLEKQILEAVESRSKNEKMYKKLGIIVGLVLVIVLV